MLRSNTWKNFQFAEALEAAGGQIYHFSSSYRSSSSSSSSSDIGSFAFVRGRTPSFSSPIDCAFDDFNFDEIKSYAGFFLRLLTSDELLSLLVLVLLFGNGVVVEVCLCRLDCSLLPSSFDGGEGRLSRDDDGVLAVNVDGSVFFSLLLLLLSLPPAVVDYRPIRPNPHLSHTAQGKALSIIIISIAINIITMAINCERFISSSQFPWRG